LPRGAGSLLKAPPLDPVKHPQNFLLNLLFILLFECIQFLRFRSSHPLLRGVDAKRTGCVDTGRLRQSLVLPMFYQCFLGTAHINAINVINLME
jgi:hypothetical protein